MRSLYAARQATLVNEVKSRLGDLMELDPSDSGMHLVGWLRTGIHDSEASSEIARLGVDVQPLSAYSMSSIRQGGLLLGYTGVTEGEIKSAVKRIDRGLRAMS